MVNHAYPAWTNLAPVMSAMAQISSSTISDAMIARICRGTPAEARTLALELSESNRAKLAIFCNARAHLRAHGREIAGVCTEESLHREGGLAGIMLLRQIDFEPDSWGGTARAASRKISLGGPGRSDAGSSHHTAIG